MEQKFKHLRKILKDKNNKKATAELEASKDPLKYIQETKNMSIKKLKGIAL